MCIYWLIFIAMRIDLQEPIVVVENSVHLARELNVIMSFLGHLYFLDKENLSPLHFGIPVVRDRLYLVLRHKLHRLVSSPLNAFTRMFHRPCTSNWRAFMAPPSELLADDLEWELKWSAGRESTLWDWSKGPPKLPRDEHGVRIVDMVF